MKRRLTAINKLIGRWMNRRMDNLRLTEAECADLLEKLEEKRETGMGMLKNFRSKKTEDGGFAAAFFAPAYIGNKGWQCATCNAAVGKPIEFEKENEK